MKQLGNLDALVELTNRPNSDTRMERGLDHPGNSEHRQTDHGQCWNEHRPPVPELNGQHHEPGQHRYRPSTPRQAHHPESRRVPYRYVNVSEHRFRSSDITPYGKNDRNHGGLD